MSLTDTNEIYTGVINLFSQDRDASSASIANAIYNIKLPSLKGNKKYIRVFVDNFILTKDSNSLQKVVCVRLASHGILNSYDTSADGASNIICTAVAQDEVADFSMNYQANRGYNIGSLPIGHVNIRITDANNADIDLDTNSNHYALSLRVEAYN